MEDNVSLNAGGIELEGLLRWRKDAPAVIITHPHPLYGGDMHNPVVETIVRACWQMGCTSLRFNFRVVGGSQGSHGQGLEEQKDVKATISFLETRGAATVSLAGYSFGAWVNAHTEFDPDGAPAHQLMVSPPVAFIPFEKRAIGNLGHIVTGSRDEFATPAAVRRHVPTWNPDAKLTILQGADHFFTNHLAELESAVQAGMSPF